MAGLWRGGASAERGLLLTTLLAACEAAYVGRPLPSAVGGANASSPSNRSPQGGQVSGAELGHAGLGAAPGGKSAGSTRALPAEVSQGGAGVLGVGAGGIVVQTTRVDGLAAGAGGASTHPSGAGGLDTGTGGVPQTGGGGGLDTGTGGVSQTGGGGGLDTGTGGVSQTGGGGGLDTGTGGVSQTGGGGGLDTGTGGVSQTGGGGGTSPPICPVIPPWRSTGTLPTTVRVCWSKEASADKTVEGTSLTSLQTGVDGATLRRWLREAVENTWGRFANLSFPADSVTQDWPTCNVGVPYGTIKIDFTTAEDQAGVGLDAVADTRVRFHVPRSDRAQVTASAIRAFGRALTIVPKDYEGALLPEHVACAQVLFGRKHRGALVGWGGRCLGVLGAPALRRQDNPIVTEECAPVSHQRFNFRGKRRDVVHMLSVRYENAIYCATVNESTLEIVTGPYMTQPQRTYFATFPSTRWIGWGGLCVVADGLASGGRLRLAQCGTSALDRWELFTDHSGKIRLSGTDYCASVETSSRAVAGAPLALERCGVGDEAQNFDLSLHDHVRYEPNLCVQADTLHGTNAPPLVLGSPCSNMAIEQMFHATGELRFGATCASVSDAVSYDDAAVVGRSCAAGSTQIPILPELYAWDYHW